MLLRKDRGMATGKTCLCHLNRTAWRHVIHLTACALVSAETAGVTPPLSHFAFWHCASYLLGVVLSLYALTGRCSLGKIVSYWTEIAVRLLSDLIDLGRYI